jgi:pimeloyl-ACP methyl ester carboxylesterase
MKMNDKTKTITLRDGHRLSYIEYGDPAGKPVFYFPGGTASGLIARTIDTVAERTNTRIIAPNRPGIGLSDFKADRTLLGWPADICELADTLQIERFAVMSESGGSPYVAACARELPGRLTAAAIVSGACPFDVPDVMQGMSPQNRSSTKLMRAFPVWLIQLIFLPMALTARSNPEKLRPQLRQLTKGMPEQDRLVFSGPEYLQAVLDSYCEAFQQGTRGPALDLKLCAGAWGSWLPDLSIEVQLWHGEKDTNTPIAMARYMQQAIPKTRATFIPGEGHVSLMRNHGQEILEAL